MAGATKVQTRPGKGRSPNSWYGRGSQAASMSAAVPADALDLASATGNPLARSRVRRAPGEPGVTAKTGSPASKVRRAPTGLRPDDGAGGPSGRVVTKSRPKGKTKARNTSNPGEPGHQDVNSAGPKPKGSIGKNPGETTGSTKRQPTGSDVTAGSSMNQGSAAGDIPSLVGLAKKLGALTTLKHLQAAGQAASGRDYRQGVVHLARAHETARQDGNVQLMNGIQVAHRSLRQQTP